MHNVTLGAIDVMLLFYPAAHGECFLFLQLRNDCLSFREIGDGWFSLLASWRCVHVPAEEHGMVVNSVFFPSSLSLSLSLSFSLFPRPSIPLPSLP